MGFCSRYQDGWTYKNTDKQTNSCQLLFFTRWLPSSYGTWVQFIKTKFSNSPLPCRLSRSRLRTPLFYLPVFTEPMDFTFFVRLTFFEDTLLNFLTYHSPVTYCWLIVGGLTLLTAAFVRTERGRSLRYRLSIDWHCLNRAQVR